MIITNLFNLIARISLDSSEFERGIEQTEQSGERLANKSLPQLGGALDKWVNRGLAVAGASITAFGLKGIQLASDLTEVENVTSTVFGDMNSEIDTWSKNAINQFGLSELQAKKFNGTMGALVKSAGVSGEEMKNMSLNLTGLSADFASFYNLSHEEAFDKIKAGIVGETEPLKSLGINMSVANMEAFALTKGIETQWKEMTQAEQTTLRYQYIMEQGSMAAGDFAKTLDTSLANQLRVAKNEVEAMAGEIGQKLLPYILDAIKWIRENKDTIILWGSAILGAAVAIKAMLIINTIVGAIKAWTIATQGMTIAQKLLNLVMLANPLGIVIALVGALAGAFIYLWNTSEEFRTVIINGWNAIKEVSLAVWGWLANFFMVDIPNAWNSVKEFFAGIPDWFKELWDRVVEKFREWGENISNFFTETIPQWISNIFQWFSELPYKIGYALGYALAAIVKWGIDTWNYLVTNVPIWIDNVVKFFSELPGKIFNWLSSTLTKIKEWGINLYNESVRIGSEFINNIVLFFSQLPSKIWTWLLATINNVITFGYNLSTKAKEAGLNMVTNIINAVKNLPSQMLEIGKNIVKGVWDGITGMGSWITKKVTGFFSGITDGVKGVLGIHSPSRVFKNEVGAMMAQGVGIGFTEEMPDINNEIQKSINTDVDLNKNTTTTTDSNSTIIGLLQQLVNKSNIIELDGREVARGLAPYQEENDIYNSRSPQFAY